jgi:hypothetical protein
VLYDAYAPVRKGLSGLPQACGSPRNVRYLTTQFRRRRPISARFIRPVRTQQLSLSQHRLHGLFLQIRRVTEAVQDSLYHHPDSRSGTFADGPVDRHTLSNLRDQLGCNDFQLIVTHRMHGAFIGRQSIVERDLVVTQTQLLASGGFPLGFRGTQNRCTKDPKSRTRARLLRIVQVHLFSERVRRHLFIDGNLRSEVLQIQYLVKRINRI